MNAPSGGVLSPKVLSPQHDRVLSARIAHVASKPTLTRAWLTCPTLTSPPSIP